MANPVTDGCVQDDSPLFFNDAHHADNTVFFPAPGKVLFNKLLCTSLAERLFVPGQNLQVGFPGYLQNPVRYLEYFPAHLMFLDIGKGGRISFHNIHPAIDFSWLILPCF